MHLKERHRNGRNVLGRERMLKNGQRQIVARREINSWLHSILKQKLLRF